MDKNLSFEIFAGNKDATRNSGEISDGNEECFWKPGESQYLLGSSKVIGLVMLVF